MKLKLKEKLKKLKLKEIFKKFYKSKYFSLLLWIIVMFLSFVMAELFNTNNLLSMKFLRILFNMIIIFIMNIFFFSIIGSIRVSAILSSTVTFILSIANYIVYCFRGTPLDPLDILSIETGFSVASTYKLTVNAYFISAFVVYALIIFICCMIKYRPEKNKYTIISRISFAVISICFIFVCFNTSFMNIFDLSTHLWKPKTEYTKNGFLASFLKQSVYSTQEEPENYSLENLSKVAKKYTKKAKDENTENKETIETSTNSTDENNIVEQKKPNIIIIMNESFSDMSVHRKIKTNEEVLPYFNSLIKKTIHGRVHSSVFGGKTPNAEWEFLTNNSMAFLAYGNIPYQQYLFKPTTSLVSTLEAQGYTSYSIHPYYGSGYRRTNVYPLLGFDHSYFLEDMEDDLEIIREYASDLSTYKELIKLFEAKKDDELFFNFTITMQNHSGYEFEPYEPTITLTDVPNCPKAEQYLSIIKESDNALKYLIDYFKKVEEPTIILFFGDHQPPYLEQEYWDYLNKFKTDSLADDEIGYLTPYFIWANYDIDKKEHQTDDISLNYLSSLLLDVAELDKTPYMYFLDEMREELPVITGHGYMDNTGTYHSLDEQNEYLKMLEQYKMFQYNHLFDTKNTIKEFFSVTK
ncbi:MAG: LTA synthase family protein [Clostridia bacterium]|nr:LTA synthase family protein [Clostridia bacterium]